jgi:hypothetical protein
LSWMFHDFPFNSIFGWSWLLGCCHIVSQLLLDNVAYDPSAKTKTIENPRNGHVHMISRYF